MVCQGLDKGEARAVWQPFFDWVSGDHRDFSVTEELGAGATPRATLVGRRRAIPRMIARPARPARPRPRLVAG